LDTGKKLQVQNINMSYT